MKFKQINLAFFQFISFIALSVFLTGVVVLGYSLLKSNINNFWEIKTWTKEFGLSLVFDKTTPNAIVAGILFYTALGLAFLSWIFGWNLFRMKERNLYDSLFLLFIMIPVLSNIFALLAQIHTKKILFTETSINKQKIIDDETKELKLKNSKK